MAARTLCWLAGTRANVRITKIRSPRPGERVRGPASARRYSSIENDIDRRLAAAFVRVVPRCCLPTLADQLLRRATLSLPFGRSFENRMPASGSAAAGATESTSFQCLTLKQRHGIPLAQWLPGWPADVAPTGEAWNFVGMASADGRLHLRCSTKSESGIYVGKPRQEEMQHGITNQHR